MNLFSNRAERYGQKAIGKVEFRSGFVVSIESAMIPSTSYRPSCGDKRVSGIFDRKKKKINEIDEERETIVRFFKIIFE